MYTLNGFGKLYNILDIDFLCPTLNHWCHERREPVVVVLHVLDKKKGTTPLSIIILPKTKQNMSYERNVYILTNLQSIVLLHCILYFHII